MVTFKYSFMDVYHTIDYAKLIIRVWKQGIPVMCACNVVNAVQP